MLPVASFQFSRLNFYQRLVRKLIECVFSMVLIPAFRFRYGTAGTHAQQQLLRSLPVGTVGRAVADLLAAHRLQLIPRYENHDLKHVLLGYAMTPDDELKLKAFMLGNGDWSLASVVLSLLMVLTPEKWPDLWQHYQRGCSTPSIVRWDLADYATQELEGLQGQLGITSSNTAPTPAAGKNLSCSGIPSSSAPPRRHAPLLDAIPSKVSSPEARRGGRGRAAARRRGSVAAAAGAPIATQIRHAECSEASRLQRLYTAK